MGLEKAKSLLEVKEGKTFLDLIAEQVKYTRSKYDSKVSCSFQRLAFSSPRPMDGFEVFEYHSLVNMISSCNDYPLLAVTSNGSEATALVLTTCP